MDQLQLWTESLPTTPPQLEAVRKMEKMLLQLPQLMLEVGHTVFGGMCARTMMIPRGTALVGALTSKDNICIMYGDILVTTDEGPLHLSGFHVIPAGKGFKRGGIALDDTWWTTIWRTELTDISSIEDEMTDESDLLQTRRALPFQYNLALEEQCL